jgi:hypothetical protein
MTQIPEKVSQTAGLRSRRKTYLAAQMFPPVGNDAVSASAQIKKSLEKVMSRRPLVLLALAIASLVASACSDVTAPRQDGDTPCRSGYTQGSGNCE